MKTVRILPAAACAAFALAARAGGFSVSTSTALDADADWRGKSAVTVAAGATLDLAGHHLSLSAIAGSGVVTDTVGGGVVYMDVSAGVSVVNTNVAFAGALRFVKAGAGEFRQACMGHSYCGGTLVAAGTLRCKAGDLNSEDGGRLNWGRPGTEIRVERGATLDLRDSCNNCYWNIVLAGGRLLLRDSQPNPAGDAQVQYLKLLADSSMDVCDSGFIGSGYGRCRIDLNGRRLTVSCARGHAAYMFNTTFVSSGSLRFVAADGSSVLMDKVPVDASEAGAFFRDDSAKGVALVPAPREMRLTGGWHRAKKPPKMEKVASIPPEGYELSIRPDGMTIRHSDDAGAFYANTTLSQMGRWDAKEKCTAYPCLEIKDSPKFRWRGVHLDDSRHFLGKDTVLHILEQMSWFKLNVLHWHLTDDQLWSLEIPGYPELQKYGEEFPLPGQKVRSRGEKVANGFYTANDVRVIVAYAKARHIAIVPEIELPGHSAAAIFAYPELCCFPQEIYARNRDAYKFNYSKFTGIYCFGNPDSVRFLEQVFDHVCELFPSEVIHIGGDECFRDGWKRCPKCQAFMKREGLKGVEQIQPWVTRHFTEYLAKKGRRVIGWDEIFIESADRGAGGSKITTLLPKSAMGMCWRAHGAGASAANQGFDIVMAPYQYTYFDYRQGLAEDPYLYPGGWLPLERVYQFDPLAGVDKNGRAHVVGGQCCNWTSHTFGRHDLEWKLWPRGLAIAEVLWTYPDPKKRDFVEFSTRAAEHRRRLIREHVNCAPLK